MEKLIKLTDTEAVLALTKKGFRYMKEKINKNQDLYVFQATPELLGAMSELFGAGNSVAEDKLRF